VKKPVVQEQLDALSQYFKQQAKKWSLEIFLCKRGYLVNTFWVVTYHFVFFTVRSLEKVSHFWLPAIY